MDKCNLCKKNDANKTGSHIVPHFLLKRIENIEGKTGRGYEIGFTIGRLKAESHFGMSVQPETLEETYGEITNDDISNNTNPLIVDNFFCSDCEERLAKIENLYAMTIRKVEKTNYQSGISSGNGILFWASIFWRLSVNGKNGIQLTENQNEFLRNILDTFLPRKNGEFNNELFTSSDIVQNVSYKIMRCHNNEKDDSKWMLFHPEFIDSFCLFIDEFVIIFSLNGSFEEIKKKDCFGINKLILKSPTNKSIGEEIIKPFDRSIFIKYTEKAIQKINYIFIQGLFDYFDRIHVELGGKGNKMPMELKMEIIKKITSEEKKIGRKYNREEIVKSTYEVLKNYT